MKTVRHLGFAVSFLGFSSLLAVAQVEEFPHVAEGVADSIEYVALIIVTNRDNNQECRATLEFFDDNGKPIGLRLKEPNQLTFPDFDSRYLLTVKSNSIGALRGGSQVRLRSARVRVSLSTSFCSADVSYLAFSPPRSLPPGALKQAGRDGRPQSAVTDFPLTHVSVRPSPSVGEAVLPVVHDIGGRLGIAISNRNPNPISGTATVYGENGQTVGSFPVNIEPLGRFVGFLHERLQLPENFRGLLRIVWSGGPNPTAFGSVVGLVQYANGVLAAVPVGRSTGLGGRQVDIFPHLAEGQVSGFDYVAQIVIANGDSSEQEVTVDLLDDSGATLPMALELVGGTVQTSGSLQFRIPARGVRILRGGNAALPARSGWVRLTKASSLVTGQVDFLVIPRPVTSQKIDQIPLTHVFVQQAVESSPRALPIVQDFGGRLGFAVANHSTRALSATGLVNDESGQTIGTFPISVGPMGRVVTFADEKLQFSHEFRGLLLIRWSDSAQIGSVVGLVQYANGVLAAVP